ncbi:MAG TPA: D-alanyl-D-alanine carboxypeptidase/D-alanyl-D-alanine-endopeptidase [Pyrinomonadaceae bacterium]|nr:D-alanyl-D-alanine carboxypeptidase/D-alanyl-D-alanine-endopeptidase [Pyrinomonadaceae bacterium]
MNRRLISVIISACLGTASLSASPSRWVPQRERKATSATQSAVAPPAQEASPSPTPTPAPTPAPERTASTTRTLAELQTRIVEILHKPEFAPAIVAVKVASLDTGRVLFEENAHKLVRPASNMKLYTVATALDRLTPDFRFSTSAYARSKPDQDGTLRGDLTIYGRGDPSLAARFNNGDYLKGIDDLATKIANSGLKRVEGDLIGDETYFTGPPYGSGWEWEDLTWYYGAEVSSLTVNDNALDLFIKPGAQVGAPALITTGPSIPYLTIVNHVTTAAKGTRRSLTIYRPLAVNTLEVSGTIALDDRGYTGGVGVARPGLMFMNMLRAALQQHGVKIKGQTRTITDRATAGTVSDANELARLMSPPFSVVAANTLKPSQNLYTEIILRTLGEIVPSPPTATPAVRNSEDAGLEVVKVFLREAGVNPDTVVLSDGSGLSRNDMISVDSNVQLLTYMSRHKYFATWKDALPIAGVDGTLRNRMRGTVAENNLRAKTGSLASASSLSGYVTSAAGENLVFSIIVNNYPSDAEPRTNCIDPIALLLASFAGHS